MTVSEDSGVVAKVDATTVTDAAIGTAATGVAAMEGAAVLEEVEGGEEEGVLSIFCSVRQLYKWSKDAKRGEERRGEERRGEERRGEEGGDTDGTIKDRQLLCRR